MQFPVHHRQTRKPDLLNNIHCSESYNASQLDLNASHINFAIFLTQLSLIYPALPAHSSLCPYVAWNWLLHHLKENSHISLTFDEPSTKSVTRWPPITPAKEEEIRESTALANHLVRRLFAPLSILLIALDAHFTGTE